MAFTVGNTYVSGESALDGGPAFGIRLVEWEIPATEMHASTTHRLLVVEDEALVAASLSLLLTKLGYEVVAIVDSGEDAVKQTFALMPDLILMDVVLRGGMDGTEAARQIRVTTGRPVVFITGRSDPLTLQKARECEPYGYILKPFGERELLVQIEMALYRHQMETARALARREMETAHDALRTMRGLLPVCAGCKKIQETDGSWRGLEEFFALHTQVELTHGFCPECEKRLYGTSSRPPFPYVMPVLNPGPAPAVAKKKPAAAKPRAGKNKK